eukprot:gb/GFBE01059879.1/.p1 GENE.gb/GFBE01059879.1/~~gb/GFBE01059879.1/.p1  ORF type:complete len:846 (+),score=191.75 gb/GFBE01059879.1/:1-2538(+)
MVHPADQILPANGTYGNSAAVKICEVGGSGVIMPGPWEANWPSELRGILYGLFLIWCFLGVMVVSDVFMSAIECITSKKTRKKNPDTGRYMTVLVWNPTVANLSLMALGSSAPEILLSVIELLGNNYFSGDLGPSTIVGSAAFNLLMIIAVCIISIPTGEVRRIKELQVYGVTAFFSVFAYLWLLIILLGVSPHVVELWEGTLTFVFFWILLALAYMADRGMIPGTAPLELGRQQVIGMSKEELAERRTSLQAENGGKLCEDQITKMLVIEGQAKSYASYRVAATRKMVGGRPVEIKRQQTGLQRAMSALGMKTKKVVPIEEPEKPVPENVACIQFKKMQIAVLESVGHVDIAVVRQGLLNETVTVNYATKEGSAKQTLDYEHVEGTLTFGPNETEQKFTVKIIDDVAYEIDEEFYIALSDAAVVSDAKKDVSAVLGPSSEMTVVIIDDDLPGMIAFPEDQITVHEKTEDFEADIMVVRKNGSTGKISCSYKTEDSSARAGLDFEPVSGTLVFEEGETMQKIKVMIKARGRYDKSEMFRVILHDVQAPAKFDPDTDGGADSCVLTVMIGTDQVSKDQVDRIMSSLQTNWQKSKMGYQNWSQQFKNAFYVLGGEDEGDDEEDKQVPTVADYVVHVVTLPWKLFFALIPPTDYCGGWLCFVCSLVMIGLVTALVGDVAALFGCVLGLPDEITAITVVALGTSLPDTFASKTAAQQDPFADASVGNVTGSNSVNVFLGLGLPWMIGSIYWSVVGRTETWNARYFYDPEIASVYKEHGAFIVKAGNLAFSVGVFTCCAIACMILLLVRRKLYGGELGGPYVPKVVSSALLVVLWLIYIALSSWYTLSNA